MMSTTRARDAATVKARTKAACATTKRKHPTERRKDRKRQNPRNSSGTTQHFHSESFVPIREEARGDCRPASTCTDLSFYASLSSVLGVVYYKSMCVHCSGSLLQLIHECKLIDCYLDFYTSIKCCYCFHRVLSFDVLESKYAGVKMLFSYACCA